MSRIVTASLTLAFLLAFDFPCVGEGTSFPELVWKIDRRVKGARRAFASPVEGGVVYVAAEEGLWRTDDAGGEWKLIAKTGPEFLGTIADLDICPARPDSLVLGSRQKGVFLSDDGGTTWRRAGGVAAGLATEKVREVMFAPEDRAWNTLLAVHGSDAPGLSKSIDGGRHWRVIASARFFRDVLDTGQVLLAASATAGEPDDWNLARSVNYAETWNLVRREGLPACGTMSILPGGAAVWGMNDAGLVVSADAGADWEETTIAPRGRWQSLFVTPGRTVTENWFWAYDPFLNGLMVGGDAKTAWTPRNRGLYVNRMIRAGANVVADAAALRFYACINGMLYVAGHVADPDGPTVRGVATDPSVLDLGAKSAGADARRAIMASAKEIVDEATRTGSQESEVRSQEKDGGKKTDSIDDEIRRIAEEGRRLKKLADRRRIGVRVRVEHPKGPAAVRSVTVTPDLFGLGPVALADDGKHDDDEAGDGTWGGAFRFVGDRTWDANKAAAAGRLAFPGTRTLPVTVEDADGRKAQWTLPVTVFFEPHPVDIRYDTSDYRLPIRGSVTVTGPVKASKRKDGGPDAGWGLEVVGSEGTWEAFWTLKGGSDVDLTGLDHVTFAFRGMPGARDVEFFLVDELAGAVRYGRDKIAPPTPGRAVALVGDGYLPAMDGKWHTVKIPTMELVRDVRFMRRHLAGFGLRPVEGTPGTGTWHVGEVRIAND